VNDHLSGVGRGSISSFTISDLIHEFYRGRARDHYVRYVVGGRAAHDVTDMLLGGIKGESAPAEVLDHIGREVDLCEEPKEIE